MTITPVAACPCGHIETVSAQAPVRVNGAAVPDRANVERVRCANCGEPRWIER